MNKNEYLAKIVRYLNIAMWGQIFQKLIATEDVHKIWHFCSTTTLLYSIEYKIPWKERLHNRLSRTVDRWAFIAR
jgi:hypothetical protein